jgi:hypothetical protein
MEAPDGSGGVHGNGLADYQPIEKHPNGGQMLFYRRRRPLVLLNISRDQRRPEIGKLEVPRFTPNEKFRDGENVRGAGVFVADVGGEEFNEAPSGLLAGTRNSRRKPVKTSRSVCRWELGQRRGSNELGVNNEEAVHPAGAKCWLITSFMLRQTARVVKGVIHRVRSRGWVVRVYPWIRKPPPFKYSSPAPLLHRLFRDPRYEFERLRMGDENQQNDESGQN